MGSDEVVGDRRARPQARVARGDDDRRDADSTRPADRLRGLARTALVHGLVGLGAGALVLTATAHVDLPGSRQAMLLIALCALSAVLTPAARGAPRAVAAAVGLAAGGLAPSLWLGGAPAGLLWIALWGAALGTLSAALSARTGRSEGRAPDGLAESSAPGQAVATSLGLALIALPHLAGAFAGHLEGAAGEAALRAVLHTPLPALSGTFAQVDVLRGGTLYRVFPLGQALPWAYPSALEALLVAGGAWALALGALLARPLLARATLMGPRLAPAGAALALLLLAPGTAQAQLFPEAGSPDNPIGDMETRVELGYYVPVLRGLVQLDGRNGQQGASFSFNNVLELDPLFIMPTFEVQLTWENAGRLSVQYMEAAWEGESNTGVHTRTFEETQFQPQTDIDSIYRYRTIALGGGIVIPATEFLEFEIMTTQRYVKHEVTVRGFGGPFGPLQRTRMHNSMEAFIPTFGAGADLFIWNVISVYGNLQWLDLRTSWFGGEDGRWEYRYREWHVGARLELVEHAHIAVEWFSLETVIVDGKREKFDQRLNGGRLEVAIKF